MNNTKQQILFQIKQSVLLNKELASLIKKVIDDMQESELQELLQKLLQEEEEIIKNFLSSNLLKKITTKESAKDTERLIQQVKQKMYMAEEERQNQENDPDLLLRNF